MRSSGITHNSILVILACCLFAMSCEQAVSHIESPKEVINTKIDTTVYVNDTVVPEIPEPETISISKNIPEQFVDIQNLDPDILVDIPYATEQNFAGEKLYPCSKCLLLTKVANQLVLVNKALKAYGYKLKMLDCYRPNSIQKKLWNKNPDSRFVMSPSKGSGHGRGTAVDVTLTTLDGKELDMGSAYDEFSSKAYYMGETVSQASMRLRWILKKTMREHGFNPIRTEWWHFQYGLRRSYPVQDFIWTCE